MCIRLGLGAIISILWAKIEAFQKKKLHLGQNTQENVHVSSVNLQSHEVVP